MGGGVGLGPGVGGFGGGAGVFCRIEITSLRIEITSLAPHRSHVPSEGQLTFCMGVPQQDLGVGEVFLHFAHLYRSATAITSSHRVCVRHEITVMR